MRKKLQMVVLLLAVGTVSQALSQEDNRQTSKPEVAKLMRELFIGVGSRGRFTGIRTRAAHDLGRLGADAKVALPFLVEMAQFDESPRAREAAFKAIESILVASPELYDEQLLDLFVDALQSNDANNAEKALTRYGEKGLNRLVADLDDAVGHDRQGAAARAIGAFGKQGEVAVEPLLGLLQTETDAGVLKSVVYALGEIGNDSAFEPMLQLLKSDKLLRNGKTLENPVRDDLVQALGKMPELNNDAVKTIIRLFESGDVFEIGNCLARHHDSSAPAVLHACEKWSFDDWKKFYLKLGADFQPDVADVLEQADLMQETYLQKRKNAVHYVAFAFQYHRWENQPGYSRLSEILMESLDDYSQSELERLLIHICRHTPLKEKKSDVDKMLKLFDQILFSPDTDMNAKMSALVAISYYFELAGPLAGRLAEFAAREKLHNRQIDIQVKQASLNVLRDLVIESRPDDWEASLAATNDEAAEIFSTLLTLLSIDKLQDRAMELLLYAINRRDPGNFNPIQNKDYKLLDGFVDLFCETPNTLESDAINVGKIVEAIYKNKNDRATIEHGLQLLESVRKSKSLEENPDFDRLVGTLKNRLKPHVQSTASWIAEVLAKAIGGIVTVSVLLSIFGLLFGIKYCAGSNTASWMLRNKAFNSLPYVAKWILNSEWSRRKIFERYLSDFKCNLPQNYLTQSLVVQSAGIDVSISESIGGNEPRHSLFSRDAMIIGKSGIGKSVSIQKLMAIGLDRFNQQPVNKIPLFINLKYVSLDQDDFANVIVSQFANRGDIALSDEMLRYLLDQGGFLILIDSLNEKPQATVKEHVNRFLNAKHVNNTVVLCSQFDFLERDDLQLVNLAHVTHRQARDYFKIEFNAENGDNPWDKLPIESKKLAENPFNLTLLVQWLKKRRLHSDTSENSVLNQYEIDVPQKRSLLYKDILESDAALSRFVETFSPGTYALCRLAFVMYRESLQAITKNRASKILSDALECQNQGGSQDLIVEMMDAIDRSKTFRSLDDENLAFAHELLCAFLASRYIAHALENEHLSFDDVRKLGKQLRWVEVFCFFFDQLDRPNLVNELFRKLIDQRQTGADARMRIAAYACKHNPTIDEDNERLFTEACINQFGQ